MIFFRKRGFDVTQKASSLIHIDDKNSDANVPDFYTKIIYFPFFPTMSEKDILACETALKNLDHNSYPKTLSALHF